VWDSAILLNISGYEDEDLEKPKFKFTPSSAKIPYRLSVPEEIPVIQVSIIFIFFNASYYMKLLYSVFYYNYVMKNDSNWFFLKIVGDISILVFMLEN